MPDGGYSLGVRLPGDEEPVRGDTLAAQLVAAGVDLIEPDDHGLDPILAVHDPGQAQVVPYLFAPVRSPPAGVETADRRPSAPRPGCTRRTRCR